MSKGKRRRKRRGHQIAKMMRKLPTTKPASVKMPRTQPERGSGRDSFEDEGFIFRSPHSRDLGPRH